MKHFLDFISAHQVATTLGAYWFISCFIGALPAPTATSGQFYKFFFKFANTFGGNLLRAFSTALEGSPNWKDAVTKLTGGTP
jgi:hypothetical protein